MLIYSVDRREVAIARRAIILDTNVTYAAFWPEDSRHEASQFIIEIGDQLILTEAVIIETWGMLVGRGRRWDRGLAFLGWVNNPGSGVLVVQRGEQFSSIRELSNALRVDCVDAILLFLADHVSQSCALDPPIRVATFDTSDFFRCRVARGFKMTLLDMNTLEEY